MAEMSETQVDDAGQPEANARAQELRRLTHLYRLGVLTNAEFLSEQKKLFGSGLETPETGYLRPPEPKSSA
jgi:FMN phosphatase YigB (HAD superfamily)